MLICSILINFVKSDTNNDYSIINHIYLGANFQIGYQFKQGVFISSHLTVGFIGFINFMLNKTNYRDIIPSPDLINPGITFGGKVAWGRYRSYFYEIQNSLIFGGAGKGKEYITIKGFGKYSKKRNKIWISYFGGIQYDFQRDNQLSDIKLPNFHSFSLLFGIPYPLALTKLINSSL